ncbi:MAG: hypothetical protein ACR2PH_13460, partial [Desulfobulbia bacterium]
CWSYVMNKFLLIAVILSFVVSIGIFAITTDGAIAQNHVPGQEEFGLTKRELVKAIEDVEIIISQCMREAGFKYIAADYRTVRRGMIADKTLPGMSESVFLSRHGFGISTFYTGKDTQLADGYSPGKIGLGKKNIRIFRNLSSADRVAYNRTLFGDHTDATFAVGLESEDFSRTGGCTRKAVEQVFTAEQLRSTYYNPLDALVKKDPRMTKALKIYSEEMRKAGFQYDHPDDVEPDIRKRLDIITGGATVPVDKMSNEAQAALKKLQAYERAVAPISEKLEAQVFDPIEERIHRELFARRTE